MISKLENIEQYRIIFQTIMNKINEIIDVVNSIEAKNEFTTQEMITSFDKEYDNPPCLDCGAKTKEEAQEMCICNGDKDNCHGCHLWPD
jgi:hypothetical protein